MRFLVATRASMASQMPGRFLDIGAGSGRHMLLAAELNFRAFGLDISSTGLLHVRQRLAQAHVSQDLALGAMTRLPFAEACFHASLSYGVFYYGVRADMLRAIAELHRVLVRGGRAFVVLRSTDDYRFGKGREIEPNTFQLEISDTNEFGTIQHFLTAGDVREYFSDFSRVTFEKAETTFFERTLVNSDWLITAEK